MKKWIMTAAAVTVIAVTAAAQTWKTGDLTATLREGTLTISGSGKMADYDYQSSEKERPWHKSRNRIINVNIQNGVTHIGDYAFYKCDKIASITIPNSVTTIGENAFTYCENLKSITIPSSVTTIRESAFSNCHRLISVMIPENVNSIGHWTFNECRTLIYINVNENNNSYSSGNGVLFNKNKTVLVQYPGGMKGAYRVPNGVTTITTGAFADSRDLTAVIIPKSVTTIEELAFVNCEKLATVTINNNGANVEVGENAFPDLTNVVFTEGGVARAPSNSGKAAVAAVTGAAAGGTAKTAKAESGSAAEKSDAKLTQADKDKAAAAEAYFNRGLIHARKKSWGDAISDLTEAIKLDYDGKADAYFVRGRVYYQTNNYDAAISDLTEAVKLNPNDADFYALRGVVYLAKDEFPKAATDARAALEIDPANKMVNALVEALSEVAKSK